ncbi:MAG: M81 family metallopeptidase [Hyphomicrobiaceae bacterium]
MRIAVAGFQHETNTFAPVKADYEAFAIAKSFPPLCRGAEMDRHVRGKKLPVAGAIATLEAAGAEIVPLLWCMATPSAHVTEDAYERIVGEMLALLADAGPLDGICLELHGAMVAEHVDDGEGELLRRIRGQVGKDMPISISLDLHSNMTPAMIEHADYIDMYRYYPHTDMVETGARAADGLLRILRTGQRPAKAFRQIDFLIPINGGCTDFGPARDIYLSLMPDMDLTTPGLLGLSFASGFPHADFPDCGPSVFAYAETKDVAEAAVERLASEICRREGDFLPDFFAAPEAVGRALEKAEGATKPVVIADTQDNPGGGGPGDTTGVLRALIDANARGSVIGAIIDPATAEAAHAVGEGATADFAIGGKRLPGDEPVACRARVRRARSDGWTAVGAMKGGMSVDLGRVALLEVEPSGVLVAIASRSAQTMDSSIFRHLGLVPEKLPVIVVKSSVHFRADFTPLSSAIIVAKAPGPVAIDHTELPYKRLRSGMHLMPRRG